MGRGRNLRNKGTAIRHIFTEWHGAPCGWVVRCWDNIGDGAGVEGQVLGHWLCLAPRSVSSGRRFQPCQGPSRRDK